VVAPRRGLISRAQAALSFKALKEASQCNLNFYPELKLLDSASKIAKTNGATIYDPLYIALAHQIEDKLLTRDRKQKEAADKLKVSYPALKGEAPQAQRVAPTLPAHFETTREALRFRSGVNPQNGQRSTRSSRDSPRRGF